MPRKKRTPTDATEAAREAALKSQRVFSEIVWKDRFGKPVTNAAHHNLISDFLDWCQERGIPALVLAPMGSGKALADSEPVLMADGSWRPIGSLAFGDKIMDPGTGGAQSVLYVQPQGVRELVRVTFSDRTSVICDWDHLWTVRQLWNPNPLTLTTREIARRGLRASTHNVKNPRGQRKFFVPVTAPLAFPERPLPLAPYTLGVLLGDGCLTQHPRFTTADREVSDGVLADGYDARKQADAYSWSVCGISDVIRGLGLQGHRAESKWIPPEYFTASVRQRLELLAGLLDTDGSLYSNGRAWEYCTVSSRLAEDVAALVRGLGGTATITTKETGFLLAYRLYVKMPVAVPCRVPRKRNAPAHLTKAIESIEVVESAAATCIAVSGETRTFITRGYTVTHNSEVGQAYVLRLLAKDPKLRVGIVCDKDEHAAVRVSNIMRYIKTDEDFRSLFPGVRVGGGTQTRLKFRLSANQHAKDESLEGAGVMSSGTGSRKDVIFFDDCVTAKNAILEPAQRERVISGYRDTWLGRIVPGGWHFYIGTVYHASDLTHVLMNQRDEKDEPVYALLKIAVSEDFKHYEVEDRRPGYGTKHYSVPLWDGVWGEKQYRRRYAELTSEGDATSWFSGYRNMIVDPDRAAFRKEMFTAQYEIFELSAYTLRVMYADPASSGGKENDFYSGVVLGWMPRLRACCVLDAWYVKSASLTKRVDIFLDKWEAWKPHIAAVEGRHELAFAQRIEEMAVERGAPFRLRKVTHVRDKESRIAGLTPLLERRRIWVDGLRFPFFWKEAQLFPRGSHDDALDALEGAWDIMRKWLKFRSSAPTRLDFEGEARSDPDAPPVIRRLAPDLAARDRPSSWGIMQDILFGPSRTQRSPE